MKPFLLYLYFHLNLSSWGECYHNIQKSNLQSIFLPAEWPIRQWEGFSSQSEIDWNLRNGSILLVEYTFWKYNTLQKFCVELLSSFIMSNNSIHLTHLGDKTMTMTTKMSIIFTVGIHAVKKSQDCDIAAIDIWTIFLVCLMHAILCNLYYIILKIYFFIIWDKESIVGNICNQSYALNISLFSPFYFTECVLCTKNHL